MRNFFNRIINRLDIAEERVKELEDKFIEMIKIEAKEKKEWGEKSKTEQPRAVKQYQLA